MALTSWPFYSSESGGTQVLEDEWSAMARQWAGSGVRVTGAHVNGFKVAPSTPAAMTVAVAGAASPAALACVRGHWVSNTADTSVPITANTSGLPRKDRIVLNLDPSTDAITLTAVAGAPSATPTPPAVTQSDTGVYQLPLATVLVPSGATTITTVTDERVALVPPPLSCPSGERPTAPAPGQVVHESDTGLAVVWDQRWRDGATTGVWRLINAAKFPIAGQVIALSTAYGLIPVNFPAGALSAPPAAVHVQVGSGEQTARTPWVLDAPTPTTSGFIVAGLTPNKTYRLYWTAIPS